jgi:hypothetical protein
MRLVVLAMLNLRIMLLLFVSQMSMCTLEVLETKIFVNKRNIIFLLKTLQKRRRISKYRLYGHDTCITIIFSSVAQFLRCYLCHRILDST